MEAYTPATDTWSELAPLPDGCQSMAVTVGPDGLLYTVGGACNQTLWSNQLLIYDPASNSWTSGTPLPDGRAWAAGAWGADGRLYVVGGYNDAGYLGTGYAYDPKTAVWSPISPLPQVLYQHAMVAVTPDLIVVLGGCGGGAATILCPAAAGYVLKIEKEPTAAELLGELIQYVTDHQLKPGTSWRAQLENVLAAVNVGDKGTACSAVRDFVNHIDAQSGKKLSAGDATYLREGALRIAVLLGCI